MGFTGEATELKKKPNSICLRIKYFKMHTPSVYYSQLKRMWALFPICVVSVTVSSTGNNTKNVGSEFTLIFLNRCIKGKHKGEQSYLYYS